MSTVTISAERALPPAHTLRCSVWRSRIALLLLLVFVVAPAGRAFAQEERTSDSFISLAGNAIKSAALDPSTYVPAGLLYTSSRLDWNSSQPFFQHGAVEENPRYTMSGLPHSQPLSYQAGNRLLLEDAISVASISFANNAIDHLTVRVLSTRYPEHTKLWKTLGWVERAAVATSMSYILSMRHFEQWQQNQRRATQLGY